MVNFSRTFCMVNDSMDKNHLARDLIYAFFIQNNRRKQPDCNIFCFGCHIVQLVLQQASFEPQGSLTVKSLFSLFLCGPTSLSTKAKHQNLLNQLGQYFHVGYREGVHRYKMSFRCRFVVLSKAICFLFGFFFVFREGEEGLKFPEGKCTPLSTLIPPAVQEQSIDWVGVYAMIDCQIALDRVTYRVTTGFTLTKLCLNWIVVKINHIALILYDHLVKDR